MAFDIAALQEMYGAVPAETGNNTYRSAPTIGDASGTPAGSIGLSSNNWRDAVIDLRAATLDVKPGGGGWFSYAKGLNGGFSIANGVNIENARGGDGDDVIIGNSGRQCARGPGWR